MTGWKSYFLARPLDLISQPQGEKAALNEITGGPEGHFHQADTYLLLLWEGRELQQLSRYMEKLFVWWEWKRGKRERERKTKHFRVDLLFSLIADYGAASAEIFRVPFRSHGRAYPLHDWEFIVSADLLLHIFHGSARKESAFTLRALFLTFPVDSRL